MLFALVGVASPQQADRFESLLASAKDAQVRSDFQAAAEFYRQAVALRPGIPELSANLGLMYYQLGKNRESSEAFRQAIRLKPELFVPNLFLGLNYVKLKQFHEAIPYLKRAALSNPTDVQAQLALGQAYAGTGDTRLAIRFHSRATELEPANADAWYRLGVRYLEQVEADARIMLTKHKDSSYSQALIGENFSEQHAFIQAADAYKQALSSPPFPPGVHARYGVVLLNQHDLVNAEHEFDAELASSPGSLFGKLGQARLYVEQGATGKGVAEIARIWKTDPSFFTVNAADFMAGLAQAKRSELQHVLEDPATSDLPPEVALLFREGAGRNVVSLDRTSPADSSDSSSKNSRLNAAELYANGKYQQCAQVLAPRLSLLQARELRLLASCQYSTGDYQGTLRTASKLAASPSTEAEGLYWETKSAQKLASASLAHASELDSNSPKLHILLGDVYRQQKNFPDAEQEYRKALAIQPEDTGALFGLSLVLLANQQKDEALRLAQTALQKNPDDPEFNAVMGEILCALNDFSAAEPYLNKSLNAKPEYVSHVHALLGKVYAQTDRTHQAIAELKLALADDKDGSLHYQIGRLYLKVGDRNSAEQAFAVSHRIRREGLTRASVALQQGGDSIESQ